MVSDLLAWILNFSTFIFDNLLPSFNFTFPQSSVDWVCKTISGFGFLLPLRTILTFGAIEISYRALILSCKVIRYWSNKIMNII